MWRVRYKMTVEMQPIPAYSPKYLEGGCSKVRVGRNLHEIAGRVPGYVLRVLWSHL